MLGIEGLSRILVGVMESRRKGGEGAVAEAVLAMVTEYRAGPTRDDILIVEITGPIAGLRLPLRRERAVGLHGDELAGR